MVEYELISSCFSPGFLTFLNCYDVRVTTKLQDVFLFCKIGALGIVICTGMVAIYMGITDNFTPEKAWQNTATEPGKIAVSFYSGIFSYCGWYVICINRIFNCFFLMPFVQILFFFGVRIVCFFLHNTAMVSVVLTFEFFGKLQGSLHHDSFI